MSESLTQTNTDLWWRKTELQQNESKFNTTTTVKFTNGAFSTWGKGWKEGGVPLI